MKMSKKQQTECILALKRAILERLGEYIGNSFEAVPQINKDVYTGTEDPGQWAPSAVAVVHCESGIPSGSYEPAAAETWFEVDDELQGLGFNVFHENVNAAVIAFYEL